MLWKKKLFFCIRYDYKIYYVDIISVDLKIELKNEKWMQQFHDFKTNNFSHVCLFKKIIYNLKQSIKMWYKILKFFLINVDFVKNFFDYFVFIYKNDTIITVYVDNLLLIVSKINDFFIFKKTLTKRFRVKNLKKMKFYLKIKIIRNQKNRKILLNQTVFIEQLINDCDFQKLKIKSINTFIKCIDFTIKFDDQTYNVIFDKIHAY